MCRGSVTAQILYRKAKAGRRLTPMEVMAMEGFATRMRELVGEENKEVGLSAETLSGARIPIPPELVLHGDRAVITLKGRWLADTVSGGVVGRYADSSDTLTLFPNPVILVNDLARMLRKYSQCR
jgi:hypothetical protein